MKKSIINRINTINEMIPMLDRLEDYVYTYDKGTYPYLLDIKPIVYNNRFVWIESEKGWNNTRNYFDSKLRLNINNEMDLEDLKYYLSLITREFKKALKK